MDEKDAGTSGFIKFFRSLKQAPGVIRFFNRKEFHTVHGDNAVYVARNYYKTTSVLKYIGSGSDALPGVALNKSLFESVLRDLLVDTADHSIEIYEGSNTNWRLTKVASPGNLSGLEEVLFRSVDMSDTPLIMAATVLELEQQKVVGLAYADPGRRQLYTCQFVDDDQLCTLESIVVQIGARECVIREQARTASMASPSSDHKRLIDVMSRCSVLVSEKNKKVFDANNLESDLSRLLHSGNIEQHRDILNLKVATQSLAAIIAFAELTLDVDSHRKWHLESYKTGRFMRLDAAAMRALHVMPLRGDNIPTFSIYGLLCRAKTAMGKRLLRTWLKQPLLDINEINFRHDIVSTMVSDSIMREAIRSRLKGTPDIERLTRKLDRGRVDLSGLCQLYRASGQLPLLVDAMMNADVSDEARQLLYDRYCTPLKEAHDEDHLSKFELLIESAIDLDKVPDEFLICASYNPEWLNFKANEKKS